MIKELTLYRDYGKLETSDFWYCHGSSSMVTMKYYRNFTEINNYDDLMPGENMYKNIQESYHLYLIVNDFIIDENFWERAKTKCFAFITFLRIDSKQKDSLLEDVKEILSEKEDCLIYHTYDAYELVIAHYDDSIDGINYCFKNMQGFFSFFEANTLTISHAEILENNNNLSENIPLISIRCRMRNQQYFNAFDNNINLHFDGKAEKMIRNGNYDYEYYTKNVSNLKFLSIFNKHTIFNLSYEDIYKAVAELEIRLYSDKQLPDNVINVVKSDEKLNFVPKRFDKNNSTTMNFTDFNQICTFLNESYSKAYFNDLFVTLYEPVKMVIEEDFDNIEETWRKKTKPYIFINNYLEMMAALDDLLVIFNTSRLHNARGFSYRGEKLTIPYKLIIFYIAVTTKMKELLIEDAQHYQYNFIMCPQTGADIYVSPLFFHNEDDPYDVDSYKRRTLMVSLPTKQILSPAILISQLGHEIAHYTCDKTRERKIRMDSIWSAMKDVLYYNLFETYDGIDSDIHKSVISYMVKIFEDEFEEAKRTIKGETNDISGHTWFRWQLREIIPNILRNGLTSIVKSWHKITLEVVENYMKDTEDYEGFDDFQTVSLDYMQQIFNNILMYMNSSDIEEQLKFFLKICDECFSDIATCIMLGLSAHDYFDYFIDRHFLLLDENKVPDFTITRMAFVIVAMGFEDDKYDSNCSKKIYTVKKAFELSIHVKKLYDEYKESKIQNRDINIDSLTYNGFFPEKMGSHCAFMYLQHYLSTCMESLKQNIGNSNENIKELYQKIKRNGEDVDMVAYKYIKEYSDEVIKKCREDNQ